MSTKEKMKLSWLTLQKMSMVDNIFFGTAMSIVPIFKPMLDDEVKIRITKNAKKQAINGSSLKVLLWVVPRYSIGPTVKWRILTIAN